MTTMILRNEAGALRDYLDALADGEFTIPCNEATRWMTKFLDPSAQRAFNECAPLVRNSTAVQRGVRDLQRGPRTCGKMTPDKAVLGDLTPFEQMATISELIQGTDILRCHTIALSAPDDRVVPLWIKPPKAQAATLMHTVIGNTKGSLKAPRYEDWATHDPTGTVQEVFIDRLNALEMQRQPQWTAALLLKSNPFEKETLAADWRYKVGTKEAPAQEASVELRGQSSARVRRIKEQSAGYNLAKMMEDEHLRDSNLLPERLYEAMAPDGYNDEIPEITPSSLVATFSDALDGNLDPLDQQMAKLFATRLGTSSIPEVNHFTVVKLWGEDA